jgi:predicted  nucleic acid-binding Zn-ribbon protein
MSFKKFDAFHESFNHVDEIQASVENAMSEYHAALKKLQELQSKFVKTPREKINEKETLKQQIIQTNRDMLQKQSNFYTMLAEAGDGDIFNDNTQQ